MGQGPTPRASVGAIDAYVPGASGAGEHPDPLKLSSNENPHGASPSAANAIAEASADLHRYPAPGHDGLRQAIGEVQGLDPARIVCGNGSDELLTLLALAYCGEGTELLYPEHGFGMYPIVARMSGAEPVTAPETERHVDVDAMLAAATPRTRVVMLANPANPTGSFLPLAEIRRLRDGLPPETLLVLDGAYAEFAEGYDGGASLVEEREDVVMTRTFSKIHGLGGLRVGWCYAPEGVVEALMRIRPPFNLSTPQMAGAAAAMRDTAWVESCRRDNAEQRARLRGGLAQLGIACDESHANFVMARFEGPDAAEAADAALRRAGIVVRKLGSYGFPSALRITVPDAAGTGRVLAALQAHMAPA